MLYPEEVNRKGGINDYCGCCADAIAPKRLLLQPNVNDCCFRNVRNDLRWMGKNTINTGGESMIDYT